MKIVIALSYYAPYVSGLTHVAQDVAEGLAARGHHVTVVCTQHDSGSPRTEILNKVQIIRTPVLVSLGKGALSPQFVPTVVKASRKADILNLHLPLLEAGIISQRVAKTAPHVYQVPTYHCDIDMPSGLVSQLQERAIDASSLSTFKHSTAIIGTTKDYIENSRHAAHILPKLVEIPPPCIPRLAGKPHYRTSQGPHVGFLGRIVEEKGIEYLVEGFSKWDNPDARLLIAGDYSHVAGGSVIGKVRQAIGDDQRIRVLGRLDDQELNDFYSSLDIFALTSVNSFEAFGIVQVEAMMSGIGVIASDLPGVRVPVSTVGLGSIVPVADSVAITRALQAWQASPPSQRKLDQAADKARKLYSLDSVVSQYEATFKNLRPATR